MAFLPFEPPPFYLSADVFCVSVSLLTIWLMLFTLQPDDHAACTRGCRLSQLEASLSNSQDDKKKVTVSCNDSK